MQAASAQQQVPPLRLGLLPRSQPHAPTPRSEEEPLQSPKPGPNNQHVPRQQQQQPAPVSHQHLEPTASSQSSAPPGDQEQRDPNTAGASAAPNPPPEGLGPARLPQPGPSSSWLTDRAPRRRQSVHPLSARDGALSARTLHSQPSDESLAAGSVGRAGLVQAAELAEADEQPPVRRGHARSRRHTLFSRLPVDRCPSQHSPSLFLPRILFQFLRRSLPACQALSCSMAQTARPAGGFSTV